MGLGPKPATARYPLQPLTIASWNIRGGLLQKTSAINDLLRDRQVDILFMQEAWILPSQAFLLKEVFPGWVADVNPPGELCKAERDAIQVAIEELREQDMDENERKDRTAELQMSEGRSGLVVLTRNSLHPHISVSPKGPRAQILQFAESNNIIIHIHGYHSNAPEARKALWGDDAAGDEDVFTRIGQLRDRNGVLRATASRIDLILAPDSMSRDGQVVGANVLRDEFPSTSDHRPICCGLAVRWLPEGCLMEPMKRDANRPSRFDIKKELRGEFKKFLREDPLQPLPANATLEDRVKSLEKRLLDISSKSYKTVGCRPRKQNRIVPEILPELNRYNRIRQIEDQIRWILVLGRHQADETERSRLLENTQDLLNQ
jgi:hypothetical protein